MNKDSEIPQERQLADETGLANGVTSPVYGAVWLGGSLRVLTSYNAAVQGEARTKANDCEGLYYYY